MEEMSGTAGAVNAVHYHSDCRLLVTSPFGGRMPITTINQISLHYELEGDETLPVVMLCNSLGATLEMWDPQMAILLTRYRVLRYDTRGHGLSAIPTGPYSIAQLGHDACALLDHLGIDKVDFCGLSMGGMTGMWLGIHHPNRIRHLALCNTAAKLGSPEVWNTRLALLAKEGMAGLTPAILDRWFTASFQLRSPHVMERIRRMLMATAPEGYAANACAVRDMDLLRDVARIELPTLVIAGSHDGSTPPELGRDIAERIKGSQFVELDAAHFSNWEQAADFTAAVMGFLD